MKACDFIKKRLQHSCFPMKFVKSLRTPFSQNTSDGYFCTLLSFLEYIVNKDNKKLSTLTVKMQKICHLIGQNTFLIIFTVQISVECEKHFLEN